MNHRTRLTSLARTAAPAEPAGNSSFPSSASSISSTQPPVTASYGDFGTVAIHEADGVLGITTKWEFWALAE
ncbi:MAG: hypothetical protein NT154_03330 [Verrucomicrobia bacterium]|nr:hypothetical protein [Verrucomicrobiota bacterium]